jgi:hypothetical protein
LKNFAAGFFSGTLLIHRPICCVKLKLSKSFSKKVLYYGQGEKNAEKEFSKTGKQYHGNRFYLSCPDRIAA